MQDKIISLSPSPSLPQPFFLRSISESSERLHPNPALRESSRAPGGAAGGKLCQALGEPNSKSLLLHFKALCFCPWAPVGLFLCVRPGDGAAPGELQLRSEGGTDALCAGESSKPRSSGSVLPSPKRRGLQIRSSELCSPSLPQGRLRLCPARSPGSPRGAAFRTQSSFWLRLRVSRASANPGKHPNQPEAPASPALRICHFISVLLLLQLGEMLAKSTALGEDAQKKTPLELGGGKGMQEGVRQGPGKGRWCR